MDNRHLTFRYALRQGGAVLALLTLAAAGCQDQSGVPLSPATLGADGLNTSRLALFDPCSDFSQPDKVVAEMVDAVNAERSKRKLPPLKLNSTLSQIAEFYACRLVDGGFFSHVDPYDGSTLDVRATNFGYPFQKVGENLAVGQRSVASVMADWMMSASHKANIIDPAYTEIGLAVKIGADSGPYWVQEFGRPVSEDADYDLGGPETAPKAEKSGARGG